MAVVPAESFDAVFYCVPNSNALSPVIDPRDLHFGRQSPVSSGSGVSRRSVSSLVASRASWALAFAVEVGGDFATAIGFPFGDRIAAGVIVQPLHDLGDSIQQIGVDFVADQF